MPVNPTSSKDQGPNWAAAVTGGETKYEKAFWMMFSAMVADPERHAQGIPVKAIADYAIKATDIGFKALEDKI